MNETFKFYKTYNLLFIINHTVHQGKNIDEIKL